MIYADNAATTKMWPEAISAMVQCMEQTCGNPSSLYALGREAKNAMEDARERIAAHLGCSPKELTFTSGGTESDNQALRSAAAAGAKCGKRHIVSTAFEHHAVLHTLQSLKHEGFEITLLDIPDSGVISAQQVKSALREDTCLVSVMFANNEIGTIQPIGEIGALCRESGVLFHTDAVQAVGHLPIDVGALNVDLLSLSAHKFGGSKGIGALYARRGIPLTPLLLGGAQERGKRAGTENLPAIVGMAAALDASLRMSAKSADHLRTLRSRLIAGLGRIPHSILNGHPTCRLPGNVSFCFEGIQGEALLLLLDGQNICASSGSACTSGSLDPSHVLLALGREPDIAYGALRLSLGYDATEADIDRLIDCITASIAQLRSRCPDWQALRAGKKPFLLPRFDENAYGRNSDPLK